MQKLIAKYQVEFGVSCAEWGIKLSRSEESRAPQEDPQSQLTRADKSSQRLGHKLRSMHGLEYAPLNICIKCAALSSCGSFNKWSKNFLGLFPAIGSPPLPEPPGWASVGKVVPSPVGTSCLGVMGVYGTQGNSTFSEENGRGRGRADL